MCQPDWNRARNKLLIYRSEATNDLKDIIAECMENSFASDYFYPKIFNSNLQSRDEAVTKSYGK